MLNRNFAYIASALIFAAAAPNAVADDDAAATAAFSFEHVSCKGRANEIRIVVTDVAQSVGRIVADLYPNDEEGFLKGRFRVTQVKFAAKAPVTKFCIRAPEDGNFAIALYHDANANNKFDKGALGMPIEPWGISNNPKVRFRPPHVEEALFDVTEDGAALVIGLN